MKKRFSIITFFLKKLHYKTPLLIYMVLYACKLYYLYLLICTLHHSVLIHSFIFQSQILLRQLNQNPCLEIHWVIIKRKFHKIFEYTPYRWSIFINSIGYATRQVNRWPLYPYLWHISSCQNANIPSIFPENSCAETHASKICTN